MYGADLGAKALILAGIAALLVGAGVAGGIRWDSGEVAQAEARQAKAEGERNQWQQRAEGLQDVIALQKAASANAVKAADKAKRDALAAENRANAAAADFIEASHEARDAVERAKKGNPLCRIELERVACAALH